MEEIIIEKAILYAKKQFENESSGHDFWHTLRVYNNAIAISENEKCNKFIVKLAALLHDVDDQKVFGGISGQFDNAKRFMIESNVEENIIDIVCGIINKMSFVGDKIKIIDSIEGKIVQDADRLDALGAIGIARSFTFGGAKNRPIYIPNVVPRNKITEKEYVANIGDSTINHFYEKLLKLKELMYTETAKSIADIRTEYMKNFLKQFYAEWDGKL
jgi:uncharacterized protein